MSQTEAEIKLQPFERRRIADVLMRAMSPELNQTWIHEYAATNRKSLRIAAQRSAAQKTKA